MQLRGNTILITGGATGIGFALAERFVALGNTVIVCGRRADRLAAASARLPGLITHQCDVTDADDRSELLAFVDAHHPSLNALFNNAGVQRAVNFTTSVAASEIATEVAVNLTAPMALAAAVLPRFRRQSAATIVNVSSGLAFCPIAAMPIYCATKAAMHSFTLSLRHQLRGSQVAVVELAPPLVETELDGDRRTFDDDGPPVMSASAFADEAVQRLGAGEPEIVVGLANALRRQGEAMFDTLNA